MNWTTLTPADLEGCMTANERESFGKTSTSSSVPDRVAPVLLNLVAEVRGMIATWSPNTLSADATKIPPSFKARALVIARWRVLSSIPGYNPGEARKTEYTEAERFFTRVAEGKIRPEPADDATPTTVPSEIPAGVQVISAPPSRTGRARMNGL